jgi:hypothetical protein
LNPINATEVFVFSAMKFLFFLYVYSVGQERRRTNVLTGSRA